MVPGVEFSNSESLVDPGRHLTRFPLVEFQNCTPGTISPLLSHFDDAQTFTLTTAGRPSRTYSSIGQARSDGNNGRVWGGMHYPSTVVISDSVGEAIANYANGNSMQLRHSARN